MIKIFLDGIMRIDSIKRNDIKNRVIIPIIEDISLNTETNWINYYTIKKYQL